MISIASPQIGKEEIRAVVRVLKSGAIVKGEQVKEFESAFAKYIGAKRAVSCSSGTAALQVGLKVLGIAEGDEVITTPLTFIATSNAVIHNRAKPVFADIDERTFNIDPVKIRSCVTKKTKAVIVVHLYGQPCNMDEIVGLCEKLNLLLVEDCAQAHGAEFQKKKVGSFGDISIFSFYATKNMTTGEGGMILTDNEAVAEKAEVMMNQGQVGKYEHVMIGENDRMTDIEAAMGIEQLKKLDRMNEKRTRNARVLTRGLSGLDWLQVPYVDKRVKPVWHQYTVKVASGMRDDFLEHLNKNGVGARVYYPKPSYMQPAYENLGFREGLCPVAESVARQVVSLPVHSMLKKGDVRAIVETVRKYR
ncbi:MAG: DegT/DnrJ/EryC1/StrS family aminotransferase [Candidatus Aenigmatarchaeota archaeon]